MRVARPLRTIAAAGLAAVGLVQAAGAQSIEQLYDATKKEGALVLYGGGPITLYEPWAREFEQRFPGIKVSVKAGSSNVLDQEIDAQMKAATVQQA
jgi:ABC-type phosphate transport system substrate-binding protein